VDTLAFDAPVTEVPDREFRQNIAMPFGTEKLEWFLQYTGV